MGMTVTHLGTQTLPIEQLHAHPDNPNHGDVNAIAASLGEFGQYRTVVALVDGTILAGHHVVEALRQRGDETVRVDVIDTDDDTAKRIMLADNRIAELGDGLNPRELLAVLDSLGDLELDPAYAQVIIERYEALSGDTAVLVADEGDD
jgi:site-specific DNA-methyltransferase (adenine-specific)